MDPAVYMQGDVNFYTLGFFLGLDGTRTPEQRAHSSRQGLRMLEHYEVIPRRETIANCPDCNARLSTVTDIARYGWRYCCTNHQARKKISPLDNTFLAKARLNSEMSADKIVMVIDLWLRRTPLIIAQKILSVSAHTASCWFGFCRDVACSIAWHSYTPIGGPGDVVEVDESHLFKRKHNVGRIGVWNHIWVVGGISRTTKKRFAVMVDRRDGDTLMPILQQCIDGNSYICTDCWRAYGDCEQIFNGHGRVNHTENFTNPPR